MLVCVCVCVCTRVSVCVYCVCDSVYVCVLCVHVHVVCFVHQLGATTGRWFLLFFCCVHYTTAHSIKVATPSYQLK